MMPKPLRQVPKLLLFFRLEKAGQLAHRARIDLFQRFHPAARAGSFALVCSCLFRLALVGTRGGNGRQGCGKLRGGKVGEVACESREA